MISGIFTLVRYALIVLLVVLVPAAAYPQEQQQNSEPVQEKSPEPAPSTPQYDTEGPGEAQGNLNIPAREDAAPAEEPNTPPSKETTYIVKQGDTLWDISNSFLKDPFLWPFIWKANTFITNADLIYPGNRLIIPSLGPVERALAEPAGRREQAVENPVSAVSGTQPGTATPPAAAAEDHPTVGKLILPEQKPAPIIDKYSMLNAGFVDQEESRDRIVGSLEGKTIFGYDDIVYVTIKSVTPSIGDKFIIYQPLDRVRHPVTGRNYGRLIKVLGILQLTEKGRKDTYSARITLSFDAAENGSMLTPYQEPTLIYNSTSKDKDLRGYILEVVDGRTINAQTDIVYLDKGSAEGVEPGDTFSVYARPRKGRYPRIMIGEAQVFLVKEHTATAVVRKSTDTIAKGDQVEFKK